MQLAQLVLPEPRVQLVLPVQLALPALPVQLVLLVPRVPRVQLVQLALLVLPEPLVHPNIQASNSFLHPLFFMRFIFIVSLSFLFCFHSFIFFF